MPNIAVMHPKHAITGPRTANNGGPGRHQTYKYGRRTTSSFNVHRLPANDMGVRFLVCPGNLTYGVSLGKTIGDRHQHGMMTTSKYTHSHHSHHSQAVR